MPSGAKDLLFRGSSESRFVTCNDAGTASENRSLASLVMTNQKL